MATLVDPATLPEVIDASTVSGLGEQLTAIGNSVVTALSNAHGSWGVLRDVFDVTGAEGVHSMLDRPRNDATEFSRSLSEARNVM